MKKVTLIAAGLLLVMRVIAHEVTWWGNENGLLPSTPLGFAYENLEQVNQYITVKPSAGEPCTVTVTVDTPTSPYLSATVLSPNPDNTVRIEVSMKKFPPNTNVITTTLTGSWSATGSPDPTICNATNQNFFSVPVVIALSKKQWYIGWERPGYLWMVSPGGPVGLQGSYSPAGPWMNVGKGSSFTVPADDQAYYFQATTQPGGDVSGMLTDDSGTPLSGVSLDLLYGGAPATTATDGSFDVVGLPFGPNEVEISSSDMFVDPGTGSNRTETAGIEVMVPALVPYGIMQFKVVVLIFPPPPACNCSPWCAIGFGTINGTQTPIYYSGGANAPQGVPANCGVPQVTVTPPNGPAMAIKPGSGKGQNSANPASGTWTVTTVVCGQTKTASITVP